MVLQHVFKIGGDSIKRLMELNGIHGGDIDMMF